jgi:hypothetical protein
MFNKIQDSLFEKLNLSLEKLQRYFLLLGLVGLCSALVVLALDWVLYPQYIEGVLTETAPHLQFQRLIQLHNVHFVEPINAILIGIGFFSLLGRNDVKAKYVFLLMFILPLFGMASYYTYMPGGYLLFETQLGMLLSDQVTLIFVSIICAYILFGSRLIIFETKLVSIASLVMVLGRVIPVLVHVLGGHLLLYYDYALSETIGTINGSLIIIGLHQAIAIVAIFCYGLLFFRELRRDDRIDGDSIANEEVHLEAILT